MIIPKLECYHADICTPDYWSSYHMPHLCVPIPHKGMTIKQLKQSLFSELWEGTIMGNHYDWETLQSDQFFNRAKAAINRIHPAIKGQRKVFTDIEYNSEDCDSVYAFFVFMPMEQ